MAVSTWIGNSSEILKHIDFHGGKDNPIYNAVIQNSNKIDEDGLETVKSRISFPVSKLEDGKYLACIAVHSTYGDSYKSVSIPLEVLYAPTVEIKIDESRSNLEEGGQAVLTCHAEAKPSENIRIHWTKNDQPIEPAGPHTVIIRNLRMEDHQHKVICHAQNAVGKGQATYKLSVNCKNFIGLSALKHSFQMDPG